MSLKRLYQDTILAHNKRPRNFKFMDDYTHTAHGLNPLCGDDYHLYLIIDDDIIQDISFQGTGCAISKAAASMMTHAVKGQPISNVLELKDAFIQLMLDDSPSETRDQLLGPLKLFEGVRNYPIRVKCATLIWRSLEHAVLDAQTASASVTTE